MKLLKHVNRCGVQTNETKVKYKLRTEGKELIRIKNNKPNKSNETDQDREQKQSSHQQHQT